MTWKQRIAQPSNFPSTVAILSYTGSLHTGWLHARFKEDGRPNWYAVNGMHIAHYLSLGASNLFNVQNPVTMLMVA